MKRLVILFVFMLTAVSAMGQTAREIIDRMDAVMASHDALKEGFIMTMDLKMPIVGTVSTRTKTLGEKYRMEMKVAGKDAISYIAGTTRWTYIPEDNTVEIEAFDKGKAASADEQQGDMALFKSATEGYDLSIKKETAEAWYIHCKKSKSNKDKDAPKDIDIAVSKADYFPLSLTAKASMVTFTMREIGFGVSEEEVTFDIGKYPGVKVVDKRK